MSKYLIFTVIEQKPKTKVIEVASRPKNFRDGSVRAGRDFSIRLGIIKWFGRWRQYAFFPEKDTVFNVGCLSDIQAYIKELRQE